jgi:hypothetical protein
MLRALNKDQAHFIALLAKVARMQRDKLLGNVGPKWFTQRRTVSKETATPRFSTNRQIMPSLEGASSPQISRRDRASSRRNATKRPPVASSNRGSQANTICIDAFGSSIGLKITPGKRGFRLAGSGESDAKTRTNEREDGLLARGMRSEYRALAEEGRVQVAERNTKESAKIIVLTDIRAAMTVSRHVLIAAGRSARCAYIVRQRCRVADLERFAVDSSASCTLLARLEEAQSLRIERREFLRCALSKL